MSSSSTTANARLPHENPLDEADALIAEGRTEEGASLLRGLIEGGRGGLMARLLFARALMASADVAGAVEAARETVLLNPGVAVAALGLGEAMLRAGQLPTAIGEFQRALRIDPALDAARFLEGCAWLDAGEAEKAQKSFAHLDADFPGLAERQEQAERMNRQLRSDANYVRHLFDQFSTDYDARMRGNLGYAAPEILRQLADMLLVGRKDLRILDLGCGTGLTGEAFRDLAKTLAGVDLSPAMIEKARLRNIYDDLRVADLESALGENKPYDLLLAGDTLVYLGDLAATFAGAARSLAPDGAFLFTVERQDGGFGLGPKRRWRHSESYLRETAANAGLEIAAILECSPRTEAGVAVPGYAVALTLAENVG